MESPKQLILLLLQMCWDDVVDGWCCWCKLLFVQLRVLQQALQHLHVLGVPPGAVARHDLVLLD
jgi:hypothetical protein